MEIRFQTQGVWRVREEIVEGDTFRARCFDCGHETLHQRFDVEQHRRLLGVRLGQAVPPMSMVRCRRCGHQQHVRDVADLVVPSTVERYATVRRLVEQSMAAADPELSGDTLVAIGALREESSGPIRLRLLAEVAASPGATRGVVSLVGAELSATSEEIDAAISAID